ESKKSRTASRRPDSPERRLWSPGTSSTVRCGPAGGMPNGSRSPWTTSVGTTTASSSARRLFSGRPGGWSGNARQRTPATPAGAAGGCRGRAGAPGAGGAPAGHEREALAADRLDDRQPGGVELRSRRGRAAARDPVGLLDERDAHAGAGGRLGGGGEIRRCDP